MRDPARIDRMIEQLRNLWKKYPDLRLCQLVTNLGYSISGQFDVFSVEDDMLEDVMREVKDKGF